MYTYGVPTVYNDGVLTVYNEQSSSNDARCLAARQTLVDPLIFLYQAHNCQISI